MQLGTHDNKPSSSARPGPAHSGRTMVVTTAVVCALFALTVGTPLGAAPLSPVVPLEVGGGADVEAPDIAGKQVLRPFAKTVPTKQVESLTETSPVESPDAPAAATQTPATSAPAQTPAPAVRPAAVPPPTTTAAPATTVPPATVPPPTTTAAPATTVPPTTAPPAPVGAQLDTGAEGAMVGSVNSMRASKGLPGLASDGNLTAKARSWAKSMADSGNLAHSGMIHGLVGAWNTAGENVGYGASSSSVMSAFSGSSGHYANIVNANFTHIGVGVYVDDNGTLWTTHLFAG
ncbi:MAG: CAP domain-containing protein [Actinomycetia bacterium]|nr:CAP domain-containing protein [Actinomycetes bacterium]